MKLIHAMALCCALAAAGGGVHAQGQGQGQGSPGAGQGGTSPGSAATGGTAAGPGPQAGPAGRLRAQADNTPGWAMMTRTERNEHQARLRQMTNYEDCMAYMAQHHEQMTERARDRGGLPMATPRRNACDGLKSVP